MGAVEDGAPAPSGAVRNPPKHGPRRTYIVFGDAVLILLGLLFGYVAIVSWSIPVLIVVLAGLVTALGAGYLSWAWGEKDRDPFDHAKTRACVLFAIALLIAFAIGYSGFVFWPRPIIAATGLAIAFGAVFLFLLAILVPRKTDFAKSGTGKPIVELLLRFLRDDHGCPSLARLQLFSWTALVIFVFAWITLIRILSGVPAFSGSFPPNLLGILTISTGSAVVASHIETKSPPSDTTIFDQLRGWSSLLDEVASDEKTVVPSLARFQMLGWTVISIGIYVVIIFLEVYHVWIGGAAGALTLPDLDPTLLVLMGISQSGYLGAKYVTYNAPKKDAPDEDVSSKGKKGG